MIPYPNPSTAVCGEIELKFLVLLVPLDLNAPVASRNQIWRSGVFYPNERLPHESCGFVKERTANRYGADAIPSSL
jgi:hypothetical protein